MSVLGNVYIEQTKKYAGLEAGTQAADNKRVTSTVERGAIHPNT
jgi:hypothetical protein